MSSVQAAKLLTDELSAQNGVGIPNNLRSLTPLCYGVIQDGNLGESVNVSSVTVLSDGVKVTMMNDAVSTNYAILALRNGNVDARTYTVSYFSAKAYNPKTTSTFTLIPKENTDIKTTEANEVCFLVFDKGQTT